MKNLIFISCLFVLFSCKSDSQKKETKGDSEWFSIELAKALSDATTDQKPYSTFVKDIEYVPLETTSKSFIGRGRFGIQVHAVTKKIIVVEMKIFSRKDGRYIGDLLSFGKGRNEYLYPSLISADDEREEFYIVEPDRRIMHIVGYDNTYKEKVEWNEDGYEQYYVLGNGNLLVPRSQKLEYGWDDFQIINIDTKEVVSKRLSSALTNIDTLDDCKHLVKFPNYIDYISMGENIFWRYQDNIRYYDYLTDSLFTIDKNMRVKPIGTLDFEKLKHTRDQANAGMRHSFLIWRIWRIVETSDEILISFGSSRGNPSDYLGYLLTYSKANKTTKITRYKDRVSRDMTSSSLYLNDFDNGVAFSPNHPTQNESAYYQFLTPLEIKELISEKGASAYTTEKEKAFKAMADKLKDDDNEVVAILHVDW